ncbi:MAG: GTP pyrophosphokinase family protein [Oscillospiraceae bacterium]|nr:GTP pyrophosphokinase family protein [Oscillospiraceae bacterium]
MKEDEKFRLKMMETVDEETMEWAQKASTEFAKRMSYYKCAMLEVETRFNVLNEEYILEHGRAPVNSIKSRLKTLPSLREKLERKNIPFDVDTMEEQLNDIAGVRVICSFPEDVYTMANAFLAMDDIEVLQEKDYIKNPKPNGYRSLHLIVAIPVHLAEGKRMTKVEIQLRTIAMDFWASLEHQLRYKQDNEFTEEMATELYACAQLSAALDLRMDKLRKSIQEHNSREELP